MSLQDQAAGQMAQQARPENPREVLLKEAMGIVLKDRNSVYGNPEDNFKTIAALWNAYLAGKPKNLIGTHPVGYIASMDVVVMNILIKVARLAQTPSYRDGLVDIAGYAACGADIQESMAKAYLQTQTADTRGERK